MTVQRESICADGRQDKTPMADAIFPQKKSLRSLTALSVSEVLRRMNLQRQKKSRCKGN